MQAIQAVLAQPGPQLALGGHAFLQGLERTQAGGHVGQRGRFGIDPLLLGTARAVQRGQRLLRLLQGALGRLVGSGGLRGLGGQRLQLCVVGRGQRLAVSPQTLRTALELAFLLLHAALFGGQDLDFLLHQRDRAALGIGCALGGLHSGFEHRQLRVQGL